ncbi:MAG: hypothetical protein HOP19_19130 [Acidobacteria bacterium]|nr:hypothetical protein [Acidobacteriota bacterium]
MKSPVQLSNASFFVPLIFSHPILLSGAGAWWLPIVSKAFNLTLFLAVMYFLVRKPAREFFATRLAEVRAALNQAAKEKAAADAKMTELGVRMSKLDAELADIRHQSVREAEAERQRLETETKADAEKLRTLAAREIEGAKQSALVQLREFTAEKAVELAEQMIRKDLTPQDDAKLLRSVSAELTKVG